MGNNASLTKNPRPDGTNEVIVLKKNGNWKRVFEGKKKSPFFEGGYPTQALFREKITEAEWNRLDAEFLDVWNRCTASNSGVFCKSLLFFPGIALLMIPTFVGFRLAEKREEAMQELVAKVNKFVFRPRGMFIKERSIMEYIGGNWMEFAWYEIALTQGQMKMIEARDTFDTDAIFYFRWRDPKNSYVDEYTVEDDFDFETRWRR